MGGLDRVAGSPVVGAGRTGLRPLVLDIPPRHVDMDVELPQLLLRQTRPSVRIDVRFALEDIGLRRTQTIARLYASLGREAALLATARAAREGDRLRDVHLDWGLVEAARARGSPRLKTLNVDTAPKTRVTVETDLGSVEVALRPGAVRVHVPPMNNVRVRLGDESDGTAGKSGRAKLDDGTNPHGRRKRVELLG